MNYTAAIKNRVSNQTCHIHKMYPFIDVVDDKIKLLCCCNVLKKQCNKIIIKVLVSDTPHLYVA